MPRGASPKREHEYEKLKGEFAKSGRYQGRAEEVAARIVNKQRAELGETRSARRKDAEGRSPDRGLPIRDYERLTEAQLAGKLEKLDRNELRRIRRFEGAHRSRKGVLELIERQLAGGSRSRATAKRAQPSKRAQPPRATRRKASSARAKVSRPGRSATARPPARRGAASRSRRAGQAVGAAVATTDHEEISRWVEERGGHPATVASTSRRGPGILRIDYPGYSGAKTLQSISWDEFFEKFDKLQLAFLHQDRKKSGEPTRFSKLVKRSTVEARPTLH